MSNPPTVEGSSPDSIASLLAHLRGTPGRCAHVAGVIIDPVGNRAREAKPLTQALAQVVRDAPDHDRHEGCFFAVGAESDHLLAAFVHSTTRGQAAGGVRFWHYDRLDELIADGLRLSRAMGQKSALAGLWWGGGKGVIARKPGLDYGDRDLRAAVFRDYGRFVSSLRGCYVTAEDVGTTPDDMATIFSATRFTTCIPRGVGGSGNPSELTAQGVVVGMEAALTYLGRGDLAGKHIAIQGLGHVSQGMIAQTLLERRVARITAVDIDPRAVGKTLSNFSTPVLQAHVVDPGDSTLLGEQCDIVAPNAVGGVLNPQTIPSIRAAIVCGGANNQLARPTRDAASLAERGVLYCPDFLVNRMGIVNCANEQYGQLEDDAAIAAHFSPDTPHGIYQRCLEVFRRADAAGSNPAAEAERLAGELLIEPHPLWPGRGREIIASIC